MNAGSVCHSGIKNTCAKSGTAGSVFPRTSASGSSSATTASDAIAIAGNVLRAARAPRADAAYARMVTRIDDPRQAEDWRRRQISDELLVLTDTIGLYRVTAQEVVDRALTEAPSRLVVVGSSPMAVALIEEVVQHRREQAVHKVLPRLETVIVAEDADDMLDDHVRGQSWYGDRPDEDLPRVVPEVPSANSVAAALESDARAVVIVATAPSVEQEQLTSRLALRHPTVRFLVWREGIQGIASSSVLANVTPFGLTLVATHAMNGAMVDVLPEDGWERIARRLHEQYVATHQVARGAVRPGQRDWDDLSRFHRESNLRRVAVALQIVVKAARTWLPTTRGSRVPRRLAAGELRSLAHVEHESWCRYYMANGFLPGPRREEPGRTPRHPALVPWDDLPAVDRHYTEESLAQCLHHLEAMGYIPFETTTRTAGQRYRRIGTVRARRVPTEWTWVTESGATMIARPRDWRVSDDGGDAWSVTDADFRRTYTHMAGDVYRRTGVVSARPTVAHEQVASTEGVERAVEGDWVVQDDAGKQWIVPAARFAEVYRLEEPPVADAVEHRAVEPEAR